MKRPLYLLILGFFFTIPLQAQIDSLSQGGDVDALITNPDKMPEFPEGEKALNDFLRKNIRYPQLAKENNIMGKVIASFIVNTDGSISDIKIVRAIGGGCDEEVIRVLRLMPNWKPGEVSGRAVKVKYTIPVSFSIK
jgi:protein TonB